MNEAEKILENEEEIEDTENVEEDNTENAEGIEEDIEDEVEREDNDSYFGVWDNQVVAKRMKVLLYGVSGTGKTTMAATFPKPLFLDLEGGMLSTRRVKPVLRYPRDPSEDIKSYAQVVDFYHLVKGEKNPQFETIVIDSLNELQLLVTQHVVTKFTGVKRQYDDQLTLADYGKANRDFSKVVRLFLKLPYHIVFTAVSTQKESFEEGDIQIAPKFVGKQVGPDIQRMMDMIGYCHAKRMQDGTSQHYVSFRITDKYLAKDRLGIAARDVPNNYESLINSAKGVS